MAECPGRLAEMMTAKCVSLEHERDQYRDQRDVLQSALRKAMPTLEQHCGDMFLHSLKAAITNATPTV
jgi:hypothetical protein